MGPGVQEHGGPGCVILDPAGVSKTLKRSEQILYVNTRSSMSCWQQEDWAYTSVEPSWKIEKLLVRDGIHLTKWGKSILVNRLVNLMWRALN